MAERDQEIQNIKEKMNNVEDDVFASFCEQIGVSNIRQYEERELRYGNGVGLLGNRYEFNVLCSSILIIIPGRNKREQRREWNLTINVIAFTINWILRNNATQKVCWVNTYFMLYYKINYIMILQFSISTNICELYILLLILFYESHKCINVLLLFVSLHFITRSALFFIIYIYFYTIFNFMHVWCR